LAETVIKGLHHITLVSGNYRVNYRFYTEVMGLRQVKLSVNQDDIYHRHAFYANPEKTTGSTITFFEWPHLPYGWPGWAHPTTSHTA
jgi:glyoxalase family protein